MEHNKLSSLPKEPLSHSIEEQSKQVEKKNGVKKTLTQMPLWPLEKFLERTKVINATKLRK